MTVTGTFVDSVTGKPLSEVAIDFYPDGNRTETPYATYQSDASGNYSITSSLFDTESSAILDVQYPGYQEDFGSPASFQGTVALTPGTSTVSSAGVSWGMIILVIAVAIGAYLYFTKRSIKSLIP
jgi:hypothetical protein